jgi:hypothetical protein
LVEIAYRWFGVSHLIASISMLVINPLSAVMGFAH